MGYYKMGDDSVTKPGKGHPEYSGQSVTRRGEDQAKKGREAGRRGDHSDARDISSVNPQNPKSSAR